MAPEPIDPAAVERLGQRVEAALAGATTVGLLYLGDRLGLLAALRAAGPASPAELAAHAGLVERYVCEWLAGMATAGLLAYEPATGRFALTPEQAACLADPASLAYATPMATLVLKVLEQADRVAAAFRQGGGVPYDRFDPQVSLAIERSMEATYHAHLVARWLPALPGIVARLEEGGPTWTWAAAAGRPASRWREPSPAPPPWVSTCMRPRSRGRASAPARPAWRGACASSPWLWTRCRPAPAST